MTQFGEPGTVTIESLKSGDVTKVTLLVTYKPQYQKYYGQKPYSCTFRDQATADEFLADYEDEIEEVKTA